MTYNYSEDKLVQETTANYFRDKLGWESVYAYNDEILGADGTLGRISEREVILKRYLRQALEKLNPPHPAGTPPEEGTLPEDALDSAIKQIAETNVALSSLQTNKEKYELFKNGVLVSFRNDKGE